MMHRIQEGNLAHQWSDSAPDHSALQIAKYCINSISKSAAAAECAVIAREGDLYTRIMDRTCNTGAQFLVMKLGKISNIFT
jgi:hypothetical protein